MLSQFLVSNTRAELLRVLFNGLDKELYLREIEKITNVQASSLQKEVKHLTSLDLITARKDGNRIYYTANKNHPIYPDLISIIEKTSGIQALLAERLKDSRIKCAFVFGSIAKNKEKAESDIDILIIGDLGMRAVTKMLSGLQEKVGREINPHIYSEEEFTKKIKEKDHFVMSVLKEKTKPIIGNVDEYR
jgi:predicted nucleotidyltransferase